MTMSAEEVSAIKDRLARLETRLKQHVEDRDDPLQGKAREEAANLKLELIGLANAHRDGSRSPREIGTALDTIGLTLDRWMAGLDRGKP